MRVLLFFIILLISACSKKEKEKLIYGKLDNTGDSWIHLQIITENGEETIDSVQADGDGSFEMPNPAGSPDFYILRTNPVNLVFLFLTPGENIEITGDASKLEQTYKVRGSKDSELIQRLRKFDRSLSDSLNQTFDSLRALNPELKDSIAYVLQGIYSSQMESFSKLFIENNISSIVSLSANKYINQQAELPLMTAMRDSLLVKYPDNKYVKDFALLVEDLSQLPPGSMSPEITMNTPEGKTFSLSSLKGKVVLVDFWASWCAPCRKDNPHLVEMYKKYKGNDFEILGVSLDENMKSWKEAIKKDNLTWPQVSDLKRWESQAVSDYMIDAIPYSVLVDRQGRIIAKGLRTNELEYRIREALSN